MERDAIDIYSFANFRESGFTYVDKADALFGRVSGEKLVEVNKAIFRRDAW